MLSCIIRKHALIEPSHSVSVSVSVKILVGHLIGYKQYAYGVPSHTNNQLCVKALMFNHGLYTARDWKVQVMQNYERNSQ